MQVDMLISNDDFMNSIIFLRKINLYLRTALNLRLTNAEKHQQFSLPSSLPVLVTTQCLVSRSNSRPFLLQIFH